MSKRISAIILVCSTLALCNSAHAQLQKNSAIADTAGITLVYLEQCATLSFDQDRLPDAQLLQGDVRFRHDNALMFCDSAYFYEGRNSFDAFGHVRIVQADTIFVYGDLLTYDGNKKLACLRRNVRMENRNTVLATDSLNYDRRVNMAYYYTGGTITDDLNKLTSVWGQYEPNTDQAMFKTDVKLENPNFTLTADTLKYNTHTYIANMVGPTTIVYQKETTIRSTKGWYNTSNERSMLFDHSSVVHADGKTLVGDTIFYDKIRQYGEVHFHMQLTDSVQKTTLYGNYGTYDQLAGTGMATDSALMVDWSSKDSLFVHADSLFTNKIRKDTLVAGEDSVYNLLRAYYGVRIYRTDMQAVCDSLSYSDRDSIMHLFYDPIMWNENSQISADNVDIFMSNNTVDHAILRTNAIVIQQIDSMHYNQLSGKILRAYIREQELYRVDVDGNAETIFYPTEDDGSLVGVNKTQSSYVKMFFKNQKVERAVLTTTSSGTMYPLDQLPSDETRLTHFFWADSERPKYSADVFANPVHTPRNTQQTISAVSPTKKNDKKKL